MDVREFYNPIKLPICFDESFTKFVLSMNGIWIHSKNLKVQPEIIFVNGEDCETGAADLEANRIFINKDMFSPIKLKRPNIDAQPHETVGALVGLQCHEIMHFHSTSMTIEESLKSLGCEGNKFLGACINVIEDTFIDEYAKTVFNPFFWSYNYLYDYFFPKEKFSTEKLNGKIENEDDSAAYLNYAIWSRILSHRKTIVECDSIMQKVDAIIVCAKSTFDIDERNKLAKKLFDLLIPKAFENKNKVEQKEFIDKVSKKLSQEDVVDNLEYDKNEALTPNKGVEFFGKDQKKTLSILFHPSESFYANKIFGGPTLNFKFDSKSNKFANLAALMKAQAETIKLRGVQEKRGKRVTKLANIATNGKIFSTPVVMQGVGFQEIGILIDFSGSMGTTLVKSALEETFSIVRSLQNGGHSVFVVGHTGDIKYSSTGQNIDLVMPIFKDFSESVEIMNERMTSWAKHSQLCSNNDDLAILQCMNMFSKKNNKKTLIIIGDGTPASKRISCEQEGIKLVMESVKTLKKAGILALSLSLTENVMPKNNKIYGIENNTYSNSPSAVSDIIKRIVTHL